MGNSGSTNSNQDVKQQYSFYDQELNEYKRMIIAQQEQINQLSNMNIKQNIKSRQTSNMFFNEIPDQQQINQQNQQKQFNSYPRLNSQYNTINTNLIENNKPKLNPYNILGIDKNFDAVSYTHLTLPTTPYV